MGKTSTAPDKASTSEKSDEPVKAGKTRKSRAAAGKAPRTPRKLRSGARAETGAAPAANTPAAQAHGARGTSELAPVLQHRDLASPEWYLSRELTWLGFNGRVLHEAEDRRTPLLERVRFLAISAGNLDEFFMKRIGGLKQQVGAGFNERSVDDRTPEEQIRDCYAAVAALEQRQEEVLVELRMLLTQAGIRLVDYGELAKEERAALRTYYIENVFPLMTPQAMDPAHPFPFVSNLSLNLLVTLHLPNDPETCMARVKVPVGPAVRRFIPVRENTFVPLEQIIAQNLDLLFPDMQVESCAVFRVTRNANTERDEEQADDLLLMIETELRDRKFAPIVRMQVGPAMTDAHRHRLATEFGLDDGADVFRRSTLLGLADFHELANLPVPELHYPAHHPSDNPALLGETDIFTAIRDAGSILLHHPYESFATSVERFLNEAADDPDVLAIKMTLYRTGRQSRVIESLVNAARNGKQVAVVVELKARFDEKANIRWASALEQVGIHVTYGVVGLKTHSKIALVVRREERALTRYVHLGTGNYNGETARLYTDFGLLTCDPDIGHDATELFNYLTTGFKPKRSYLKLLVAPKLLKQGLLDFIAREIGHARAGEKALIQIKCNALEDVDLTRALYQASRAGVTVNLLVRDTCRLRPGVPGLSENVTVTSIVGRFLEHARVFYFRNGGDEAYYIGSADLMKRNLESRVEVLVPVEAPELRSLLEVQLGDRRSAWHMQPDGTYVRPNDDDGSPGSLLPSAQDIVIEQTERRYREATRLRKRRTRAPELSGSRRNLLR